MEYGTLLKSNGTNTHSQCCARLNWCSGVGTCSGPHGSSCKCYFCLCSPARGFLLNLRFPELKSAIHFDVRTFCRHVCLGVPSCIDGTLISALNRQVGALQSPMFSENAECSHRLTSEYRGQVSAEVRYAFETMYLTYGEPYDSFCVHNLFHTETDSVPQTFQLRPARTLLQLLDQSDIATFATALYSLWVRGASSLSNS